MGSVHLTLAVALALSLVSPLAAQDTRTVAEPHYPTACKILYAELTAQNGTLPEEPIERHYRDNDRIEKAMAECPAGQAVVLHASKTGRSIFLVGPLRLRAGVTLVVDGTAAVWGSRDPRNYDVKPGSCGIVGDRGPGCLPLILAEDAPHSGIMGEGVIDGRGGAKLLNQKETWWELAHRAKVEDSNQAVSRILVVRRSNDFTLYRVTLRNSPNCHVTTEATDGFTAWGVKIDTPKWARNTDGIDPQAGSSNISIIDSYIRSGDDNISPKATAATGAVTHMTVRNTHFYNGHGFGIGSQTSGGLSHILVSNLTIDGSDNGLRIKSDRSRGGLVEDVQFQNVCIRNSPNPIVLNPYYTTFEGNKIPVYRGISLVNVHALTPGSIIMRGLDAEHKLDATLTNVVVDDEKSDDVAAKFAVFGQHGGNLQLRGDDVAVHSVPGPASGRPYSCEGKFVAFPENANSPVSAELIPPADKTFYVAADGTGDYYSVQAALNKVPQTGGLVLVAPGIYRERVLVTQAHVTLKSANPDATKTVIVFDLSKATQGSQQGEATVRVRSDDFNAENITFENDFYKTHKPDPQGANAEALHLSGDRNILRNVRILGSQASLYVAARNCSGATGTTCEPARSYFSKCYIAGNLGFIEGDGTAYFDDCEIHSTDRDGFITAQGRHYVGQESVFVFRNCRLTGSPGAANVVLGKPWRDYSSVVFLNPAIGAHISSDGWREWQPGVTHRLETAFFRVYKPTGTATGSLPLPEQDVVRYTPQKVLAGKDAWNPSAGK